MTNTEEQGHTIKFVETRDPDGQIIVDMSVEPLGDSQEGPSMFYAALVQKLFTEGSLDAMLNMIHDAHEAKKAKSSIILPN